MSTEPIKHDQSVPTPRASAYDAELEREIEAALGGMSVEDLEGASSPARGGQREEPYGESESHERGRSECPSRSVSSSSLASSSSTRRFNSGRRLKSTEARRHSRASIAG